MRRRLRDVVLHPTDFGTHTPRMTLNANVSARFLLTTCRVIGSRCKATAASAAVAQPLINTAWVASRRVVD